MSEYLVTQVKGIKFQFNSKNFGFNVNVGRNSWNIKEDFKPYIEIETNGTLEKSFFKDAEVIKHSTYKTGFGEGVRSVYSDLKSSNGSFNFETIVYLDYTFGNLNCELIMLKEPGKGTRKVVWPGAVDFSKEGSDNYTVMSLMQGAIIPNNWEQNINIFERWELEAGKFYTRSSYMPWWGQIEGKTGYMAIVETPCDGGFDFEHNSGGPTSMGPVWHSSLGKIDYNRKIKYMFLENCDYNTLCKVYRRYLIETGDLVTLKEKIQKNQNTQRIIGTPIIHTNIYDNIQPASFFYDNVNPDKNRSVTTFDQRGKELKRLKELGLDSAFVHVDGWVRNGYDNTHPDVTPPCEFAGGWDGMRKLTTTTNDLGFMFAIHDQYRDYYLDAESYDIEQAIHDEKGEVHYETMWAGGKQTLLCTHFSPLYLKRNFEELKQNGVMLAGTYLDVFSCVALDECFDPHHKMTRKQCLEKRRECFDYVRSQGIVISSEETLGWAMRDLDLVHHSPYALESIPEEGTLCGKMLDKSFGIPVPILNLVYHDCVVIPWCITDKTKENPNNESSMLHALLNGGTSYLSIVANEEEIEKVKIVCDFHKKVACQEMVKHEFLSEDFKRQKVEFEDGTTVEVDFRTYEYWIK